jgi:hypothetical protein
MRAHAATLNFADQRQMLRFLLGHVTRMHAPLSSFDSVNMKLAEAFGRALTLC